MKKVVIITGASSGIGKATKEYLREKGFVVYDISLNAKEDEFTYSANVNDYERVKSIFEDIFKKEGQIDVLVNNAGYGIAGAIENTTTQNINNLFATNLSSVVALTSMAIPYLKKTKGRIVNISSVAGVIPLPFQACYSAAKAGVLNFSKAVNNEVKPFGMRVIAVMPGDTKTGFTKARVVDEAKDNSYAARDKKSIAKMEKDEQKGKDPKTVAKVIYKVLTKKRPPVQKTVGFSYKAIVLLAKCLPEGLVNWIVKKIYG